MKTDKTGPGLCVAVPNSHIKPSDLEIDPHLNCYLHQHNWIFKKMCIFSMLYNWSNLIFYSLWGIRKPCKCYAYRIGRGKNYQFGRNKPYRVLHPRTSPEIPNWHVNTLKELYGFQWNHNSWAFRKCKSTECGNCLDFLVYKIVIHHSTTNKCLPEMRNYLYSSRRT